MNSFKSLLSRALADYGIVLALVLLCVYFSVVTVTEQNMTGAPGGRQIGRVIANHYTDRTVRLFARNTADDKEFADAVEAETRQIQMSMGVIRGEPADARRALDEQAHTGLKLDAIVCAPGTAGWGVFDDLASRYPSIGHPKIIVPQSFRGSSFLRPDNLLNIANQIAVIAIIAIGMTMVIITGGIDLSVGSLIALSAVTATLLIRRFGGEAASGGVLLTGSLLGIAACGAVGLFTGVMITGFRIPPFIVTLAMMLVASGAAFIFSKGQSIYQVPDSYIWLGRGAAAGIPVAVLLMLALYLGAHLFMSRAGMGRQIYAVGGNAEASRLSGVPVGRVLLFVYVVSGMMAGLGGIVMASQLKSGAPTYGAMYELYVIAAVVVGGTSLAGGQGRIFGTLIGAFIIAVIQNGMNLTGVESYTQKVVLGLVILGAVLMDRMRRGGRN